MKAFKTLPYNQDEEEWNDRIVIRHSRRAKRLALRLDTQKQVFTLVVPEGINLNRAKAFAREHNEWIEQKLAALPRRIPFENGQIIPVLGTPRRIRISLDKTARRTNIRICPREIHVVTNQEHPDARIARFLKKEAKTHLEALSREKASLIKKTIRSVTVRDTKTRWGSCSQDKKLSYSWRLIFSPPEALDYVVAHEVAHLVHMDHSRAFWHLCKDLSADYKTGKTWMRKHGNTLMRYGG